jgi:hypothetical protein
MLSVIMLSVIMPNVVMLSVADSMKSTYYPSCRLNTSPKTFFSFESDDENVKNSKKLVVILFVNVFHFFQCEFTSQSSGQNQV